MTPMHCRSCGAPVEQVFADLGHSPLSNAYLTADRLDLMEPTYPLKVRVCHQCWLVQLPQVVAPEGIFSDYAYFSSYSESWLRQCEAYAAMTIGRFGLGPSSQVVEVASNDGYLLQFFAARGVPVLGVEPAGNVAEAALAKGVPTRVLFFGEETASALVQEGCSADLLVGNNVLAHVPDLNDFIRGMALILKPGGTFTLEFPHLQRLVEERQFDTIYHEHFSYFSLMAVEATLARHGLALFDVEQLPSHGGSLRIFGGHAGTLPEAPTPRLAGLRSLELRLGYGQPDVYARFGRQMSDVKAGLLEFLLEARRQGRQVAGYGAPAKGNTLLNFCGIRPDLLPYTVDRSPHKQGRFLPGSHIPVYAPEHLLATRPDFVLILPWNLKDEIQDQMAVVRSWGGRFVVPIPAVQVLP